MDYRIKSISVPMLALVFTCLPFGCAHSARIGLDPLMGDGAIGRKIAISGSLFEPATSYTVLIGGFAVSPATVSSDAAGIILPAVLTLPSLPGGNLDITLTGSFTRTFTGAFRVWPNICLSPAQGNGKAGSTYVTNAAIPTGGWNGMVFVLAGTGFNANAVIPANTITVTGSATIHPDITVSADGLLPSTTVIITGNLSNGAKSIGINDGLVEMFNNVYLVNRCIGLNSARGNRAFETTITITGWGFVDGIGRIVQDSITIENPPQGTTHPAVDVVNGSFTVVVRLGNAPNNNSSSNIVINDGTANTFTKAYYSVNNGVFISVSPVRLTGLANEAIQVEGIAGIPGNIAANTIGMYEGNSIRSTTTHGNITVTGGTFPSTWVKINGGTPWGLNRLETGATRVQSFEDSGNYLSVCPAISDGYSGWTVTLSGFGFNQTGGSGQPAANSTLIGGVATTHVAAVIGNTGDFSFPCTLSQPLPFGAKTVGVDDSAVGTVTFNNALQATRTIGLSSFVVGSGAANESVLISGSGFTASSTIPLNTITFNGAAMAHPAVTVGANGTFGPTRITLSSLNSGPYDVSAQQNFPAAYRVYDPLPRISKFSDPGRGVQSQIVTFSFSFTNAQYVGDPSVPVSRFVLRDTLPAALTYVAASSTCDPPAKAEWYDTAWQTVEPAPATVKAIRWTLLSALPSGASGYAKFQMIVP